VLWQDGVSGSPAGHVGIQRVFQEADGHHCAASKRLSRFLVDIRENSLLNIKAVTGNWFLWGVLPGGALIQRMTRCAVGACFFVCLLGLTATAAFGAAPTQAPALTGPSGSGNTTAVAIVWVNPPDGAWTDIWLDDATVGTSQFIRQTQLPGTSFTPDPSWPDNTTFRVWVRAGNNAGYGPWSAAQVFATGSAPVSPPTGVPVISLPAGSGNPVRPLCQWSSVSAATFYDCWIDDLSSGTSQAYRNTNVPSAPFTLDRDLADNHSFNFWVRAGNCVGFGGWSAAQPFATGNAPAAGQVEAPALRIKGFLGRLLLPAGWNRMLTPALTPAPTPAPTKFFPPRANFRLSARCRLIRA